MDGIEVDPEKVDTVQKFKDPKTPSDIRSFVGLCGYYRKFIGNFSSITRTLYKLTEKDVKFEWTKECQEAFELLKDKLTSSPVMAHYDENADTELHTDASYIGLG